MHVLTTAPLAPLPHRWALSLSPAEGRELALAAMQAEHEAARARVAQHVGQEAELDRRKSARERAEEEDGFSGFRRSLRELIALHDRLAHEEATNAALRRDLEAACLATDAAERRFSEQEHSLVQLRTTVVRLTELSADLDLELRQQKQACAELEQSLTRAAHELRLEKEHAEAAAARHAESVAELEGRLTGGRAGRSRRFGSAEHVSSPPSVADFELQVHERAQLETLREEVERQKAMRLAAATGGPDAGAAEARLEALRAELAGAEAAHEAVVAELTAAWHADILRWGEAAARREAAEAAAEAAAAAEAEAFITSAEKGTAWLEMDPDPDADAAHGARRVGPSSQRERQLEAQRRRHEGALSELRRLHALESARAASAANLVAEGLWEGLGASREQYTRAFAKLPPAAPELPPGVAAPEATLAAWRALSAQSSRMAQLAVEAMARRAALFCRQASSLIGIHEPAAATTLLANRSGGAAEVPTALPALSAMHATALEHMLTSMRTLPPPPPRRPSSPCRPSSPAGAEGGGPAIAGAVSAPDLLSRAIQSVQPHRPTIFLPGMRASTDAAPPPVLNAMAQRQMEAARKAEAKRQALVELRRVQHEKAMEAFATVVYTPEGFGELRSCLDPAPGRRPRSAAAAVRRPVARSASAAHLTSPHAPSRAEADAAVTRALAQHPRALELAYVTTSPHLMPPNSIEPLAGGLTRPRSAHATANYAHAGSAPVCSATYLHVSGGGLLALPVRAHEPMPNPAGHRTPATRQPPPRAQSAAARPTTADVRVRAASYAIGGGGGGSGRTGGGGGGCARDNSGAHSTPLIASAALAGAQPPPRNSTGDGDNAIEPPRAASCAPLPQSLSAHATSKVPPGWAAVGDGQPAIGGMAAAASR